MAALGVSPADAYTVLKILDDTWSLAAERMLEAVARRLARGITDDGWAERKAREVLALRSELAGIMAQLTSATPAQVLSALAEAHSIGAGAAATIGTTVIQSRPEVVQRLATRLVGQLRGSVLPVIRSHVDLFQRAVLDSELAISTGTTTRREEVARTVNRLLAEGADRFVDASGRRWHLDAYARMAGRTTAAQTAVQGQLDQMEVEGRDLVIISDSARECERCRPWEGRVLSVSGRWVGREVDGRRITHTVSDARANGLWHPNCRHRADPYTPGLTRKPPAKADPEGAKAEQKLRALERQARDLKRREAAVKVLGDTEQARRLRAQIRANSARIKAHTEATGLLRRRERERPLGPGLPNTPRPDPTPSPPRPAADARPTPARADTPDVAEPPADEIRVEETVRRVHDRTDPLTEETLLDQLADGDGTPDQRRVWADAVRQVEDTDRPDPERDDTDTTGPLGMRATRFDDDYKATDWAMENWPLPDQLTKHQRDAISAYADLDYELINGTLRGTTNADQDRAHDLIKGLDEAFELASAPESVIVHRGVNFRTVEAMGAKLSDPASMQALVGQVHVEPGYVSTSIGAKAAFSGSDVYFMFRVPKDYPAINVMHLSEYGTQEREILLNRDARFAVHAVYEKDGDWYIEAEVVPEGWEPGPDWAPDPYGDAWEGYQ